MAQAGPRPGDDHLSLPAPGPSWQHRLSPRGAFRWLELTDTAYCNARKRLPLAVYNGLVEWIAAAVRTTSDSARWLGHRIWVVDGSSFSMSDKPELQRHFGQPSGQRKGCGFPVAKWLALFDVISVGKASLGVGTPDTSTERPSRSARGRHSFATTGRKLQDVTLAAENDTDLDLGYHHGAALRRLGVQPGRLCGPSVEPRTDERHESQVDHPAADRLHP